MKKIAVLALFTAILSCTSQKTLVESNSFEIGNAICQKWVGGKEKSGSGMDIMIAASFPEDSSVILKDIFFRGKQVPVTLFTDMDNTFIKAEILTNAESSKEKFDFELEPTQAVLSYLENDTLKYTKISGIKEKQPLLYNSRPKN